METIWEVRGLTGIGFQRNKGNKKIQSINVEGFKREVDGFTYFILFNSNGTIIEDAYKYLNDKKNNKCIGKADFKKRELSFTALKLLYSFLELFYLASPKDVNEEQVNSLDAFLEGGEKLGHSITFKGNTERSNSTINYYYSVYRKFFKYLKIDNSIFDESEKIRTYRGSGEGFFAHTHKHTEEKYSVSKRVLQKKETPKYISYREFLKILDLIEEEYSSREEIIVILMYKYGLRVGEVLGLTVEDVVRTDSEIGNLFLRNRATDKPYQRAKGCMPINALEDYNKPKYFKKNIGYQVVEIEEKDLEKVEEYIINTRSPLSYRRKDKKLSKAFSNLTSKNIADKITDRTDIQHNSYVFISKNGTPISNWNEIMTEIFERVGISTDKGTKEDNLNHRLRHGFAMFKVIIEKYDQLRLMKALRQSDPSSCKVYYTVDEKERGRLAHETQELLRIGGIYIE